MSYSPVGDQMKRRVTGVFVRILTHSDRRRDMMLAPYETRCIRRGEIHEIVTTDDRGAHLETVVEAIGFLGFVEIRDGGVVERGDVLKVGNRPLGHVLGFNTCHAPNHYNIVIERETLVNGQDLGIRVDEVLTIG